VRRNAQQPGVVDHHSSGYAANGASGGDTGDRDPCRSRDEYPVGAKEATR
jgi:hypothetical protein